MVALVPLDAPPLVLYDAACAAIAEAKRVDEVKAVGDYATRMRLLARQSKNRQMEIDAWEIRLRAERRLGEMMAAQRDDVGLAVGGRPRTKVEPDQAPETGSSADPVLTLADAGIDKHLANRARKYAAIPDAEFEAILDEQRELFADADVKVTMSLVAAGDKAQRRAEREAALAAKVIALPDKKYGLILDDPEWRFEVRSRETGLDRAADNHYPTSPLAEILARDIESIAAEDCAWFRWVTAPHLANGVRSIEVGGFVYKTCWIWAKDRIGTGYWNRNRHEILLLAVRGKVPCPAPGQQWDSLLHAPVTHHSEKPERFLEMLEAYFPTLPKIELNRRGAPRPGWDAWGNEADLDGASGAEAAA